MDQLQKYTPAQIAEITDVKDAVLNKELADAMNTFCRAQDQRKKAQDYKELSMKFARQAGVLLGETSREQGKRTDLDTSSTKYAKLLDYTGISPSTARNWQKIARIPKDKFDAYFAEAEFMNWEFTHYSLMRYADGKDSKQLDHQDWLRIARGYCERLQGSAASVEIQRAALTFLKNT